MIKLWLYNRLSLFFYFKLQIFIGGNKEKIKERGKQDHITMYFCPS